VANDLVVRDFVINHFRPPIKPKNFDTFLPLGPWLVDAAAVPDPQDLRIRTFVNGEQRQEGHTGDMITSVAALIAYVTEFMTLQENDVLLTGTPKGISHVHAGDRIHRRCDRRARRRNRARGMHGYRPADPLHEQGGAARGGELPLLRRPRAGRANGLSLPTETHINYTMRQPIGPWASSRPGTRRSCCRPGRSRPRSPRAARSCTSRPSGAPSPRRCFGKSRSKRACPRASSTRARLRRGRGRALTEHPDIKAIGFVGESATGSAIMAQGAATLKRVHFELGGKNPVIVFDDADLDKALDAVLFMIYSLNGERCTSSSRALVQASIYEEFVARAAERVKKIKIGHPLDAATEIGPLIHLKHLEKVLSYADIAKKDGATVAVGGGRSGDTGNFVEPTLYTHAKSGMRSRRKRSSGRC
jgi:hypothetical protein